jgi:Fe-S-cluster containining protein
MDEFSRPSLLLLPLYFLLVISPPCAAAMRYASGMSSRRLPAGDGALIQIVDAALAEATRRSGKWLPCRPGCTQCCVGVFAINQLDAVRLQHGLARLNKTDPQRARRIRERARASVERSAAEFPGDAKTGVLDAGVIDEGSEAEKRFAEFANDEPCPVLDPETGLCDLYEARPMTCRTFGPPVRAEGGLGVCELCFQGATDAQIAACEMVADPDDLESKLLAKLGKARGPRGRTVVAFCIT